MAVLRKICGITRKERRRNVDILKELAIERDIISVIQCRRLTYFGHVTGMEKDRLPYILWYGFTHGSRGKERPKKRWINNIREDCTDMRILIHEASHIATDRDTWIKHCSVSGLPEREEVSAISQVKSSRDFQRFHARASVLALYLLTALISAYRMLWGQSVRGWWMDRCVRLCVNH